MSVPEAKLVVEAAMTNPPRPICFAVWEGKERLAHLSFEDVKRAYEQWIAMESIRNERPKR